MYLYYTHPELWIGGCRFGSGEGTRAALDGAPRERSKETGSLCHEEHSIRELDLVVT